MKKSLIYSVLIFLLMSCNREAKQVPNPIKNDVLAIVNDDTITIDEFRVNYELGFAHLKRGENPKLSYLETMIDEKLFSQAGYQKALDKSDYVRKNIKALTNELVLEYFIKEQIEPKIHISPEEIKEAITQQSITFKFRFWQEDDLASAKNVREAMLTEGYDAVVERLVSKETTTDPLIYQSDYVSSLEIQPEVFKAIKDLPIGEISQPVEINSSFWLLEVIDVRRKGILESEFRTKAPSVEQKLFHKKRASLVANYIDSLLTPKNIITKGDLLGKLAAAYWEWMKDDDVDKNVFPDILNSTELAAVKELKANFDNGLIQYSDGEITLRQICENIPFEKLKTDYKYKKDLLNDLVVLVRNQVRDHFIIAEAQKKGIDTTDTLLDELDRWENKWVFEEYRYHLVSDVENKTEANEKIHKELKKLRKNSTIRINQTVLDSIEVGYSEKSKGVTIQVFKTGTNTRAWPVVDANWKKRVTE